jgi:hypothetical protein
MLPHLRPACGVAVGVVLICALGLIARYIATPLPLASPAASIPAYASARLIESDAPLPSEPPLLTDPALPSEPPLSSSDEGTDPGILLVRQCLVLAERDPLAAMEMAVANQLQDVDSGLAASLITQWARQDFDRAYEWTKAQEPGAWRDDMLARLACLCAQTDPIAAAHLVATDISAGRSQDEAVISVIHQWALQDLRGAGLWAQSLRDETLRQRASAEVAGVAAASSRLRLRELEMSRNE